MAWVGLAAAQVPYGVAEAPCGAEEVGACGVAVAPLEEGAAASPDQGAWGQEVGLFLLLDTWKMIRYAINVRYIVHNSCKNLLEDCLQRVIQNITDPHATVIGVACGTYLMKPTISWKTLS